MHQVLRRAAHITAAALLVATVLAAPSGATAAPRTDGPGAGVDDRRATTPGLSAPLVLGKKPTAGSSTETTITCYVFPAGPYRSGNSVIFSVFLDCVGGVPRSLGAVVDIVRWHNNYGYPEPGSFAVCADIETTQLLCLTKPIPCYQAGAYYDGLAFLQAVDELGVLHEAQYYVPPKWVGCLV
ncbi:hypothetical protein Val02_48920 [Virgisporangium aliadipatigenens]|uniref:Uncharacterized protein n=1 Tax=Virgisporangium aliadipatigenens TaxID=741659 RepID=A0A8J3YQG2_9ACTN|nr:hypothetical protein [Virgisporangium aliadipatigenens]GIJ48006.1 hypothetical protein Val02_48920 [Virgisporangium aliadipatigenens]